MKWRRYVCACMVLGSFWLAGCSGDDGTGSGAPPVIEPDERIAAHISAKVATATRAADDHWDSRDSIGISMFQPGNKQVIDGSFNREYITVAGNGNFTPATAATTIYFPQDDSEVEFKAYYPYLPSLDVNSMDYPVSLSDQSNLPRIDLMTTDYALEDAVTYSRATPNVILRFHHRLSKIVFNVRFEDDFFELEGGSLMIQGMKTRGDYELYEDVLTVDESSLADIRVPVSTVDNVMTGRAIILPRAAGEGVVFVITTATGEVFHARMESTLELVSGYRYNITILLRKTGVSTVTATIEEWAEGDTSDLEAS